MNNTYWKYGVAFLAGLVIGIGSTWLYFTGGEPKAAVDTEPGKEKVEGSRIDRTVSSEENWVVVEDQFPGNQVQLKAVSFSDSGWAAVYEDRDGEPGNILGAQRFDAGEHTGTVDLTRGTEEGSLYYVILHRDDGDREFDFKIDTQLLDEDGNRIEMKFQTPPHRN